MKTIKEWLSELPEPYRSQALGNMETSRINDHETVLSLSYALGVAFIWDKSPEGWMYWAQVSEQYIPKTPPPTSALSALHAIALKEGFPVEDIVAVNKRADSDEWEYKLKDNKTWYAIDFTVKIASK